MFLGVARKPLRLASGNIFVHVCLKRRKRLKPQSNYRHIVIVNGFFYYNILTNLKHDIKLDKCFTSNLLLDAWFNIKDEVL